MPDAAFEAGLPAYPSGAPVPWRPVGTLAPPDRTDPAVVGALLRPG